jgi:hypothetical protein
VRELGTQPTSFAYPFGRRWDFDDAARENVVAAGFELELTMHAGANAPDSDPTTLRRLAIDDGVELHLLVAEACGGFELVRRLGVDLSE